METSKKRAGMVVEEVGWVVRPANGGGGGGVKKVDRGKQVGPGGMGRGEEVGWAKGRRWDGQRGGGGMGQRTGGGMGRGEEVGREEGSGWRIG